MSTYNMDHMYALRIKKTSESDPDSYEATAAGFTAHLVLWRPWLQIPLKPLNYFWAFFATTLVASYR